MDTKSKLEIYTHDHLMGSWPQSNVLYTIPKWIQEYKKKRLDNRVLHPPIEYNVDISESSSLGASMAPCEKLEKQ